MTIFELDEVIGIVHIYVMENQIDFKKLRKDRGWTQQDAADFFGVDKSTVWRWENKGIPDRGTVRKAIEREFSNFIGDIIN